jgi:hypothetical protein
LLPEGMRQRRSLYRSGKLPACNSHRLGSPSYKSERPAKIENFSIGTIFPSCVECDIVIDEKGESGYLCRPKFELSPQHCPTAQQVFAHLSSTA